MIEGGAGRAVRRARLWWRPAARNPRDTRSDARSVGTRPSAPRDDPEDPVVLAGGPAAAVAIARGQIDGPVRADEHVA